MRRVTLAAAMFVVHALTAVTPATAGGSHLSPVRDRYELGEVATLVGYTSGGQLGWLQDGPFYAYLVAGDVTLWSDHRLPVDNVALGPLSVQTRGRTLRVSISFLVPDHLAAGLYNVTYCNDPCTTGLGDLIGGSLAVGVDPPTEVQRAWPLDDPEIANLADDAILTGPGDGVSAADVRAGRAVEPPGWGPGMGQARAPDERPAPPQAARQEVPSLVTTMLPDPVATATRPDPPGESRDHRPSGILLVLTVSVIAAGVVAGLHRCRARRPESAHGPTGAGATANDPYGRANGKAGSRSGHGPRAGQTSADEAAHLPSRAPTRVGGGEGGKRAVPPLHDRQVAR